MHRVKPKIKVLLNNSFQSGSVKLNCSFCILIDPIKMTKLLNLIKKELSKLPELTAASFIIQFKLLQGDQVLLPLDNCFYQRQFYRLQSRVCRVEAIVQRQMCPSLCFASLNCVSGDANKLIRTQTSHFFKNSFSHLKETNKKSHN